MSLKPPTEDFDSVAIQKDFHEAEELYAKLREVTEKIQEQQNVNEEQFHEMLSIELEMNALQAHIEEQGRKKEELNRTYFERLAHSLHHAEQVHHYVLHLIHNNLEYKLVQQHAEELREQMQAIVEYLKAEKERLEQQEHHRCQIEPGNSPYRSTDEY